MAETIRLLFGSVIAEEGNFNAQCLNAVELARRFDPQQFQISFFYLKKPNRHLLAMPHIQLIRLPPRLGFLRMAWELIFGRQDVILYLLPGRAARLFWRFRWLGRKKKILTTVETSAATFETLAPAVLREQLRDFQRADATHGITPAIRTEMRERWKIPMQEAVLPVGCDQKVFRPADRRDHQPPWKVLFVGSLLERKRPHLLLELARRLAAEPVEFHLIGAGLEAGGYPEELRAAVARDGQGKVHLHGSLPPEKVAEQMAAVDIFLLPSLHEGLPKVTLEAAATGLPVLVFDAYQTPSVVDGETGFQVQNFEELSARLRQLLSDGELRQRMGEAAVEHVRSFDWDVVAKKWQEAIGRLVKGASRWGPLPPPIPLRTVRDSFPSHGSSIPKAE